MTGLHLPLLTQSELRMFRRCPREHHFAHGLLMRPAGEAAAPLRFGTAVHAGLEAWWKGEGLTGALAAIATLADPWEHAKAAAMLTGYDHYWTRPHLAVIGLEVEFRAPLVNPDTQRQSVTYQLGGKLDGLVRDDGGRVLLLEHKTTSEDIAPGSDYWRRLRLDLQVGLYYAGARSLGHDPTGCVYDVLRKPALRPHKVDTPEAFYGRMVDALTSEPTKYYQQVEVVRLESEEADAMADAWATGRQIRDGNLVHRWPRNADACVRWGRACSYFDVCSGAASLDNPHRFTRLDTPHPELSPCV